MTATSPTRPSVESGSQPTQLGAITHVAVTVRDLSVSVPWYRTVAGSDPVLDEDTGPFRHVVFAMGSTLLGLHGFPDGLDDRPFDPRRPGLDHVAFGCAGRAELTAWAQRLTALGVDHGEISDAGYGAGLAFKDPDGLALEIFCPPGS